jgi:hypothetical protein
MKTKRYINSLGCPIAIKRWSSCQNEDITYYLKPLWNSVHFAVVPTKNIQHNGLVHLPSSRLLVFSKLKILKEIALELDDHEYIAFNIDNLPPSIRKGILDYICRRVTE